MDHRHFDEIRLQQYDRCGSCQTFNLSSEAIFAGLLLLTVVALVSLLNCCYLEAQGHATRSEPAAACHPVAATNSLLSAA